MNIKWLVQCLLYKGTDKWKTLFISSTSSSSNTGSSIIIISTHKIYHSKLAKNMNLEII